MIERHLVLIPKSSAQRPADPVEIPVPHDPHAATTGTGMARTMDEAFAGVRTMRTLRRFQDSKGREYTSDMISHVYTQHEATVRFARLTWITR